MKIIDSPTCPFCFDYLCAVHQSCLSGMNLLRGTAGSQCKEHSVTALFYILFVYFFIKLNIQLQQKRNIQHKNRKYNYFTDEKVTIYEFTEHTI